MLYPKKLESLLCTPSPRLIEDFRKLSGDIMILGLGGKMGPSLAILALAAKKASKRRIRIMGASRFSDSAVRETMETLGIETYAGDLLDESFLASLPDASNILFLAGQKFGTTGQESTTWAMNTYLPALVAKRYHRSRIVAFSTGNVYPFTSFDSRGADEQTPLDPIGEYAQSCLGRERIFQYFSIKQKTPTLLFRLNYALDLRYGVLNDIARAVWEEKPIDLSMGYVNVIWQGDANEYAIRSLLHCTSPAKALNITGPKVLSVQWLAEEFGLLLGKKPQFRGESASNALLSDASQAHQLFGSPHVSIIQMMEWTVDWIMQGGNQLGKPTHFQERSGKF